MYNNPIRGVDPTGLLPDESFDAPFTPEEVNALLNWMGDFWQRLKDWYQYQTNPAFHKLVDWLNTLPPPPGGGGGNAPRRRGDPHPEIEKTPVPKSMLPNGVTQAKFG
jgi:hypothetical protein